MLKGTMKIELADVHTGETETVLEQNMVTNQLSNIFRHMGYCKDPDKLLTDWAPHYKTLLGGLLLFDTPIEEEPDMVYPPAEANMVGCAVFNMQNSTTNTRFCFCHDGFAYVKSYSSPYDIYKIEIGNAANVVKMNRNGFTINGYPVFAINGRIYYESYDDQLRIVNSYTNEVLATEAIRICSGDRYQASYTPIRNDQSLFYVSAGNYTTYGFCIMTNYLATINNLAEPVTKTADKTMKVTYIIQEQ